MSVPIALANRFEMPVLLVVVLDRLRARIPTPDTHSPWHSYRTDIAPPRVTRSRPRSHRLRDEHEPSARRITTKYLVEISKPRSRTRARLRRTSTPLRGSKSCCATRPSRRRPHHTRRPRDHVLLRKHEVGLRCAAQPPPSSASCLSVLDHVLCGNPTGGPPALVAESVRARWRRERDPVRHDCRGHCESGEGCEHEDSARGRSWIHTCRRCACELPHSVSVTPGAAPPIKRPATTATASDPSR